MAGKERVIAGSLKTKALGAITEILPDSVTVKAHRKFSEPGSGKPE